VTRGAGVLRPYERPIVALVLALLVVLAVLLPDALAQIKTATHTHPVAGDRGEPSGTQEDGPTLARAGREESGEATPADAGDPSPLCAPREDLLYAVDAASRTAVGVDGDGRFALYGLADPDSGRPTPDSYEILTGCSVSGFPGNFASVLVAGRGPEPADHSTILRPTREARDGSLITRFSFAGGVVLEQRLRLERKDLLISYRLANRSSKARTASLRSFITPAAQTGEDIEGRFVLPALENDAPAGGEGTRVRTELALSGNQVAPFEVPRPGVPSDSGGRWGPATGPRPDRVVFAGTRELERAPFLYDARGGRPLPAASSFAVYWLGEELRPGEAFVASQWYDTAGFGG
jgi:hypothetical protein